MKGQKPRPFIVAQIAAPLAAGLLFLAAAAPGGMLLVLDRSALVDEECLAPAGSGCAYIPTATGEERQLSASAALLEPQRHRLAGPEPLLRAELSGLIDFGPEVVRGRAVRERALRATRRAS